jgi:DNA-binding XRE family transcriptional regulator
MIKRKPTSQRVQCKLTAAEQALLNRARAETESQRGAILQEGRQRKLARQRMQEELRRTVDKLQQRREELGLSLSDIEARSGLKKSALSRLENNPDANPTLLTLYRYAIALGVRFTTNVHG